MTTRIARPSSQGPLYAPRNPLVRALLVTLVAGFVVFQEGVSRLFKNKAAAEPFPDHEPSTDFLSNTIR